MTDRAQAILRDAGSILANGMRCGVCRMRYDDRIWRGSDPGVDVLKKCADGHTLDLQDPATYALCLAQLARRLGLDPGRGACWSQQHRLWRVSTEADVAIGIMPPSDTTDSQWLYDPTTTAPIGFGGTIAVPGISTADHRRALALALRATAPKEGSNG